MTWGKNDYMAAFLIIFLLVIGAIIGFFVINPADPNTTIWKGFFSLKKM